MTESVQKRKTAIVTGASSGIGKATAIRFAQDGIDVALVSRERSALEETAREMASLEGKPLVLPADLSKEEDARRCIQETVSRFDRLDFLINAAGIIGSGTVASTNLESWDTIMNINLRSVFFLMQLAVPYLEKTKGSIVNVSSITGLRAFPGIVSYCVSKAGVDQLTRCAALELAEKGIRVNAINPGVVRTQLHRRGGMDPKAYAAFLEHSKSTHPLGRVGEPGEAAELIAFLVSDRAGWITGTTISVDGGRALTCAR
jgi:NAD(P)-dependent dehydrogenase (short-subunit alcohol dehydrogenase family)